MTTSHQSLTLRTAGCGCRCHMWVLELLRQRGAGAEMSLAVRFRACILVLLHAFALCGLRDWRDLLPLTNCSMSVFHQLLKFWFPHPGGSCSLTSRACQPRLLRPHTKAQRLDVHLVALKPRTWRARQGQVVGVPTSRATRHAGVKPYTQCALGSWWQRGLSLSSNHRR